MSLGVNREELYNEVLKLVSYADLYDFAPSISEICSDLPWNNISEKQIEELFDGVSSNLPLELNEDKYLCLKNKSKLFGKRNEKAIISKNLLEKNRNKIRRLARLPYVRTIALSGALAFNNASQNDDVDLFLVVQSNRLWLVDLYNLFVLRIWNEKILRGKKSICPNYIVETVSMKLREHDFFTAHQIKHMRPLYDEGCFDDFIEANDWIKEYFPSAGENRVEISKPGFIKKALELIGDIFGASLLNAFIYAVRGKRLKRKKTLGLIKGDYGFRFLKANDSRRGAIASIRLADSLEKISSGFDGKADLFLNSKYEIRDGIIDCMTDREKKLIEPFIGYYRSTRDLSQSPSERDLILSLPFVSRKDDKNKIWKRRAKNFIRVLGLIHELESDDDGPILDLGAGNCWLSRRLVEDGYRAIAYDACIDSPSGLLTGDILESHLGINIERCRGLIERLPFKERSFKGVVASASFHYAQDPRTVIQNLKRILEPNGWIIIFDSPVFSRESDGQAMISSNALKYNSSELLDTLEYKPKWFVNINEIREIARSEGFQIQIINTRNAFKRSLDRLKNTIMSKRQWPAFPIILLRKEDVVNKKRVGNIQKIRYLYYKLFVEGKLNPSTIFTIDRIELKIPAGVFHPLPFDSSRILLRTLRDRYKNLRHKSVLDMGTGSGIHAIASAKLGAKVAAIDIYQGALNAAKANAEINGIVDKIDFIESDLFDSIPEMKFDVVLFNPPFYKGTPRDSSEAAWFDENRRTMKKYLSSLSKYLSTDGESLIILSDRADISEFQRQAIENGLQVRIINKSRSWDETYFVFLLRHRNEKTS